LERNGPIRMESERRNYNIPQGKKKREGAGRCLMVVSGVSRKLGNYENMALQIRGATVGAALGSGRKKSSGAFCGP